MYERNAPIIHHRSIFIHVGYEDIALGSISIEPANYHPTVRKKVDSIVELIHFYKWFESITPETHRSLFFHLYWEQSFGCRLNSKVLAKLMPKRTKYTKVCTGKEQLSRHEHLFEDMGAFRGALNALNALPRAAVTTKIAWPPKDCLKNRKPIPRGTELTKGRCLQCIWDHVACINFVLRGAFSQFQVNLFSIYFSHLFVYSFNPEGNFLSYTNEK